MQELQLDLNLEAEQLIDNLRAAQPFWLKDRRGGTVMLYVALQENRKLVGLAENKQLVLREFAGDQFNNAVGDLSQGNDFFNNLHQSIVAAGALRMHEFTSRINLNGSTIDYLLSGLSGDLDELQWQNALSEHAVNLAYLHSSPIPNYYRRGKIIVEDDKIVGIIGPKTQKHFHQKFICYQGKLKNSFVLTHPLGQYFDKMMYCLNFDPGSSISRDSFWFRPKQESEAVRGAAQGILINGVVKYILGTS